MRLQLRRNPEIQGLEPQQSHGNDPGDGGGRKTGLQPEGSAGPQIALHGGDPVLPLVGKGRHGGGNRLFDHPGAQKHVGDGDQGGDHQALQGQC